MTVAMSRPPSWRIWLSATRPKTLAAGVVPVAVGAALAVQAGFRVDPAIVAACLAGALLLQIACNFANDAGDGLRGTDGPQRLGPTRAVAAGWVSPRAMLLATAVVLVAALILGLWLYTRAGWPVLAIGLSGAVAALAYTLGPVPLAYVGLGDLFVFLFFGLAAVLGTVWSLSGDTGAVLGAVPAAAAVGLQAVGLIAVNNLRDLAGDARAGKRTLAVRLGGRATRHYIISLHVTAALCLAFAPGLWHAAVLAFAGGAVISAGVARHDGADLNPWLGRSAALELATGAAIVLSVVWS